VDGPVGMGQVGLCWDRNNACIDLPISVVGLGDDDRAVGGGQAPDGGGGAGRGVVEKKEEET
tara:strand:+ start:777 stop:962 length:186 start_codon:yes stop_codon:yes gene_type:complete